MPVKREKGREKVKALKKRKSACIYPVFRKKRNESGLQIAQRKRGLESDREEK